MASTFVSITTSAYTCVEFMLVCPSNLPTVYKSLPAASVSTANVWRLVWKLTFFVISASAVIFLRYLLHTPNIVSSNTFCSAYIRFAQSCSLLPHITSKEPWGSFCAFSNGSLGGSWQRDNGRLSHIMHSHARMCEVFKARLIIERLSFSFNL